MSGIKVRFSSSELLKKRKRKNIDASMISPEGVMNTGQKTCCLLYCENFVLDTLVI